MAAPFVLLDDARSEGASEARLYRGPAEVVVARAPGQVLPALDYLDRRELITDIYLPRHLPIALASGRQAIKPGQRSL